MASFLLHFPFGFDSPKRRNMESYARRGKCNPAGGLFYGEKEGLGLSLPSGASASAPIPSCRARCRTELPHRPALEHHWAAAAAALPCPQGVRRCTKQLAPGAANPALCITSSFQRRASGRQTSAVGLRGLGADGACCRASSPQKISPTFLRRKDSRSPRKMPWQPAATRVILLFQYQRHHPEGFQSGPSAPSPFGPHRSALVAPR